MSCGTSSVADNCLMSGSRYSVFLTAAAQRDLESFGSDRPTAETALLALESDPTVGGKLKANLRGARSLHFGLRGAEYRAAYLVLRSTRQCLVFMVGPRRGFYEKALRRLQAVERAP